MTVPAAVTAFGDRALQIRRTRSDDLFDLNGEPAVTPFCGKAFGNGPGF